MWSAVPYSSKFWEAYTSFATRVVLVFPPTSLPKLKSFLEEDFDTRGYLPLGGMLAQKVTSTELEGQDLRALEQVHPNEEQLMRIWDISHDAHLVAEIQGTQMESFRAQFSLFDSVRENEAAVTQEVTATERNTTVPDTDYHIAADDRQLDEDARTETTDPVGDAFREVLGVPSDDEQEDDEIVWNPRYVPGIRVSHDILVKWRCFGVQSRVSSHCYPGSVKQAYSARPYWWHEPSQPSQSDEAKHRQSPPRGSDVFTQPLGTTGQASNTPKTTAQDLLNNVMGLGRPAHKADLKSSFPPHFSQQQPLHSPVRDHQ
jgi:hypothetical protein